MVEPRRQCSGCTACCKLLPVKEINKPASTRCEHQRTGKGCSIYSHAPVSCRVWSCRWLIGDDTADLRRPDLSHYVIDVMPDHVTFSDVDGNSTVIPAVQVWLDKHFPDAHKDPALRAYLDRRGREQGMVAIMRWGSHDGFVLIPPSLAGGDWIERDDAKIG